MAGKDAAARPSREDDATPVPTPTAATSAAIGAIMDAVATHGTAGFTTRVGPLVVDARDASGRATRANGVDLKMPCA